jgi:hypothetical protein
MNRSAVSLLVSLAVLITAKCSARSETPLTRDLLLYHTPVDYRNTPYKKHALAEGIYYYYGIGGTHAFEAEFDRTKIDYTTDFKYDQKDITFAYSQYAPGKKTRVGIHLAKTSTVIDNGLTVFAGSSRYRSNGMDSQLDISVSGYAGYSPYTTVLQITPAAGRTFESGKDSSVYLQTKIYTIYTSNQAGGDSKHFYSVEQTATYKRRNIAVSVSGWAGKQMLAVRNDGFVVYNTLETRKGGYGISISYDMPGESKLAIFAKRETFSDPGAENRASAEQTGLSVTHTF